TTYTVRSGDTLSGIASRFGVSWQSLAAFNYLDNPNLIFPGQVLKIPGANDTIPNQPAPAPQPPPGNVGSWSPGPGQLQGADTSSWQDQGTFEQSIAGAQWAAIKATEGTGYTDPTFQARWNE